MRQEVRIRDRVIGQGRPLFILAECGVTCNYDLQITKELIDAVKASGADAIKLIFWFPDEIMSDKTISYAYDTLSGKKSENMFEMLSKLVFTLDQWREIKALLPGPICGEDAQKWVSRSRRDSDERCGG